MGGSKQPEQQVRSQTNIFPIEFGESAGRGAWIYQEDQKNSGGGIDPGAKAHERIPTRTLEEGQAVTRKNKPRNLDNLTSLDEWLDEEKFGEAVTLASAKRVIAMQLDREMRMKRITKTALARKMSTSRAQIDGLLDPTRNVTLETLLRAARIVGRKLKLELV